MKNMKSVSNERMVILMNTSNRISNVRVFVNFLILAVSFSFAGCRNKGNPYPEKSRLWIVPAEDISLEYQLVSQEGQTLEVRLKNLSDKECSYSEQFSIEYEYKGEWYTVPPQLTFMGSGKSLWQNGEDVHTFDTTEMYGKLPSGHYRFAQAVNLFTYEDVEVTERKTYRVAVEFSL